MAMYEEGGGVGAIEEFMPEEPPMPPDPLAPPRSGGRSARAKPVPQAPSDPSTATEDGEDSPPTLSRSKSLVPASSRGRRSEWMDAGSEGNATSPISPSRRRHTGGPSAEEAQQQKQQTRLISAFSSADPDGTVQAPARASKKSTDTERSQGRAQGAPGGSSTKQAAPMRRSQSVGANRRAKGDSVEVSPPEKSRMMSMLGANIQWGGDYDMPTLTNANKYQKEQQLSTAMSLLHDIATPKRKSRKKKSSTTGTPQQGSAEPDAEGFGEAPRKVSRSVDVEDDLEPDKNVLKADATPKKQDVERLKTDRSVEILRKELSTMYDKDKEKLLQEFWTTYEFIMKKKGLSEGEDVDGLILLQKVRMVEVSLLGEEELDGVDETLQVSRFEISHIEGDELVREMRGEDVNMKSSVIAGGKPVYVEELDQNFTSTGMPVLQQEEKSTSVMIHRLRRMEKIIASTMREHIQQLKHMQQEIVRHEKELAEKKQALKDSKERANTLRQDMVRMQITVEDIDSQLRNLTMHYTAVDLKRAGKCGFDMQMDNSVACFLAPKGPVMLVSAKMPGETVLRWRVRVTGNASWALGVIPEDQIDNAMYFFTDLKVGVNSKDTTRSSLLPRESLQGLWIEIVAELGRKLVIIRGEGRLRMELRQSFDYDCGARLAVCCFLNCTVEVCTV